MTGKAVPEFSEDYDTFFQDLKRRIQQAQVRAALSVNKELINLYWQIGKSILDRQSTVSWGAKVIDKLSADLRTSFPDIKGFSTRNLKYMRAFAESYPDFTIVQQAAAQIPWTHNCAILDKVKGLEERQFYVQETIGNGWSRDVLTHQIESNLYHRQGKAITNFGSVLPKPQSELVQQLLKDPYYFDFLDLSPESLERDLERSLIAKLKDFLLELGAGFAFVGSQFHLEVGNQDFYLDLLFYHLKARCFIVVDLKITDFQPEYAGKMSFYLSAVDDLLKHEADQPTVGLILCKTKKNVIAEYALRNSASPVGVSEYRLLPGDFKDNLPSIELLEEKLPAILEPVEAAVREIEWLEKDGDYFAQIDDFTITLSRQRGGRWHVSIVHEEGYSHPWPPWQSSLEAAKIKALKLFQDASAYVKDYQAERNAEIEAHRSEGWDSELDGSLSRQVGDHFVKIQPRSGGRWAISIVHKNGSSPTWQKWQPNIEVAKSLALECVQRDEEIRQQLL